MVTSLRGRGTSAGDLGSVSGRILIIDGVDDVLKLLEDESAAHLGAIALVADAGATFLAPVFADLAGLVCRGGSTGSHLAIVSRDFGTPALFSVVFEGREPVDGDRVTVDSGAGLVVGMGDEV